MWRCTCGYQNSDIGNFCIACGAAKSDVISAQIGENVQWHYYKDSNRCGPVAASEIAGLLRINEIDRNTLVWKAGMTDWVPLCQTALNTLVTDVLPPIPMQAVSDIYAWLLATLPLIFAIIIHSNHMNKLTFLLVVWILNILFWALDVWELKKTNNHLGFWIWTVFALVPAYLFIRSSKAGKRYGYSITYIALLVILLINLVN